ncbi:hypothetical protein EG327_010746 [Venturia inaequalis]|uniref:Uncharacterized protein n=1 Tax=Venturia inaequalis TaxID=5025 RepID=A0A8H3ZD58_VENIN|nr:hypothetical protein EG327_010746 [Venturia inaequalis]
MSNPQPTSKEPSPPSTTETATRTVPISLIAFIYLTLSLLVLSFLWFCYVMVLIQRLGRFENWGLPPEERKEKREEERRRVVGVRNTYDVEAQPPHPHSQSSTTSAQIRRLQEELQQLENNPEAANVTSNIPTQTQSSKPLPELPHFNPRLHTQPLPRTPPFENIDLDSSPSGKTVTDSENDTTLVNTSQQNHPIFHHPSLTNGRLNTPASQGGGFSSGQGGALRRHPSQAGPNDRANPRPAFPHQETPRTSGNKWRHNDSDSDNDVAGDEEAIFTLFAARAREFEAGDPVPRRRVRAPPAENYGAAEDVPGFSVPAGPMRPWTPRVGDEGRLANDYMEERRVAGENVEGRRGGNQELPVVERPENAHIPRKTDPGGTFLIGDSDDEAEKRI